MSAVRATKPPPAARASAVAFTGVSKEPPGVEGERVPGVDVGENWPLVRP